MSVFPKLISLDTTYLIVKQMITGDIEKNRWAQKVKQELLSVKDLSESWVDEEAKKKYEECDVFFLANAYHNLRAERIGDVEKIDNSSRHWTEQTRHRAGIEQETEVPLNRRVKYHLLNEREIDTAADGYVYVLQFEHTQMRMDPWYYVGETVDFENLLRRITSHNSLSQDVPIYEDGVGYMSKGNRTIRNGLNIVREIHDIERIKSVEVPESIDKKKRLREVERETSYEVAIEYDTTNIAGGK